MVMLEKDNTVFQVISFDNADNSELWKNLNLKTLGIFSTFDLAVEAVECQYGELEWYSNKYIPQYYFVKPSRFEEVAIFEIELDKPM